MSPISYVYGIGKAKMLAFTPLLLQMNQERSERSWGPADGDGSGEGARRIGAAMCGS